MALEGELKGLDGTICDGCDVQLILTVCRSAAGWYLGYFCGCCGPYSRETGYFATREEAEVALGKWLDDYQEPVNLRDTEYHPSGR